MRGLAMVLVVATASGAAATTEAGVALAGPGNTIAALAADADGVYWSEADCALVALRKGQRKPALLTRMAGRASSAVEPTPRACPLAVDARGLFVAWAERIWSVPRRGGDATAVADAPGAIALAADGRRWYWLRQDGGVFAGGTGEPARKLAAVPGAVALVVDGTSLVVADAGTVAFPDGSEDVVRGRTVSRGGTRERTGALVRVPLGGGAVVREAAAHPCGLAVADRALFVADGGAVERRGASAPLVSAGAACSIAVADGRLYWLRVTKEGSVVTASALEGTR